MASTYAYNDQTSHASPNVMWLRSELGQIKLPCLSKGMLERKECENKHVKSVLNHQRAE